jgi:hypothetical protein
LKVTLHTCHLILAACYFPGGYGPLPFIYFSIPNI